jgi:hypothetical protein
LGGVQQREPLVSHTAPWAEPPQFAGLWQDVGGAQVAGATHPGMLPTNPQISPLGHVPFGLEILQTVVVG